MHDIVLVQIDQHIGDLPRERHRRFHRKSPLAPKTLAE